MVAGIAALTDHVTVVGEAISNEYQSVSRKLPSAQKVPQTVSPHSMASYAAAEAHRSPQRLAASAAQMPSHATAQQKLSTAQTRSWQVASSQPMPPLATQQELPEVDGALQPPLVSAPHASASLTEPDGQVRSQSTPQSSKQRP